MYQYGYVNPKRNGQQFYNQNSVPPYYSQPKPGGINGLGIPESWSGPVYSNGWKRPEGVKGYEHMELPANSPSPSGQMGFTAQEPSSDWTSIIKQASHEDFTPHGHNGNLMQPNHDDWQVEVKLSNWSQPDDNKGSISQEKPGNWLPPLGHDDWESQEQVANWPQLPYLQGSVPKGQISFWEQPINHAGMFAQGQPQSGAPSAGNKGFNPHNQPFPWTQPFNHAGMMTQGYPANWAPTTGNKSFNSPKQPFPWAQPVNQTGMFSQGPQAALLPPSSNPFGFNPSGKQPANFGGFGKNTGWGGQVNPMGWGNNQGNGQPGLGGLLKLGKGTMNGIGIIGSLLSVGKFLF